MLNTSGIALRFKKYTSDLYEINEEKTETGWKYFVNNIPSFTHEPLAPSLDILTTKVSFSLSQFSLAGREREAFQAGMNLENGCIPIYYVQGNNFQNK